MLANNEEFLSRLRATFMAEAQDHISALSAGLISLEKAAGEDRRKAVEAVFREAHSLKGAARAVNMTGIEKLCQALESVFSALKSEAVALSAGLFDLLHNTVDHLGALVPAAGAEPGAADKLRSTELITDLNQAASGTMPPAGKVAAEESVEQPAGKMRSGDSQPGADEKPAMAETVRVATAKLTSILYQTEEMLAAKLTSWQRVSELHEINSALKAWAKELARVHPVLQKVRHALERENSWADNGHNGQELNRVIEFLDWNNAHLRLVENRLKELARSAERDHHSLEGMVGNLLESSKKILMTPLSSLLEIFPKLVRDLSRDQGKEINLEILGGDVEADRRILEEMKDPLIHLVRNCIDHGIESPEERQRKKKPPRGEIRIAITQKNGHMEILVADDGAGIEASRIKGAAVKAGILSQPEAEALSESQAMSLIFQSGVSTSPIITDLSGRGLGLAIVREKAEQLNGRVSFESNLDRGTVFLVTLPLTMASFRGVLVRLDDRFFVIPAAHVHGVVKVNPESIKTVENRETIELDGKAVSLVRLAELLDIPVKTATPIEQDAQAVVIGHAGQLIAYLVTEIINEQEILVKSLGKQLSRVRNIAAAAILGTGSVIPILNVSDLMKSSVRQTKTRGLGKAPAQLKKEKKQILVLVVEDSITARTLLKNILEAAGYTVTTAVDGIDGFTQLRTGQFNIVVSDVDMPRMNGFGLTQKIRGDSKLADIPVVLVTALESREDKERGVEAGANAYIVKSRFDQSNLLETIGRLV